MAIILQQLLVLYIFLGLGFLFGKKNKNSQSQTGVLSFLLVNLFLPSKVFGTFADNFTVSYIKNNYKMLLTSIGLLLFLHLIAIPLARLLKKDRYERKVFEYSITISNYGYLGYALVEGIYGEGALTNLILYAIPFAFYTYTVGYAKLTDSGRDLKRLLNPMTASIFLGILFGLTGWELPMVFDKVLSSSSACVGVISMLLTGITLSSFSIKSLISDKSVYGLVGIRLILVPALIFGICKLLRLESVIQPAVIMACMPNGLNPIVFSQASGKSPELGAKLAFISHVLSVITVPIWLNLI